MFKCEAHYLFKITLSLLMRKHYNQLTESSHTCMEQELEKSAKQNR